MANASVFSGHTSGRWISGLVLSIAVVMWNTSCSRTSTVAADSESIQALPVGVAKIMRRDLSENLVLTAEFRPFQDIAVHAKVAGYVKKIFVDVGDRVREGQELATLESPELQSEVVEAGAAEKRSEAEIKRAQGELDRAQSAYEATHLAFTRLETVNKTMPNLVAQQDLDDARGRDLAAAAQIDAAKGALAAAQQQLEVSKANLDKTKDMFAYVQISAPFSGVITKRYADTGAMIQAGTNSNTQAMPVVTLAQDNLLRLIVPVPESSVPKIHIGMPVEVQVPALGETFRGVVARSAGKLDMATRTMETEIDVPNPQYKIVPGMYANATLVLEQRKNALAAPVQALGRQDNQATVFVVDAGKTIKQQPVTLGLETPDYAEIVSGLSENDMVVVRGRSQLRPGMKVEPKLVNVQEGS